MENDWLQASVTVNEWIFFGILMLLIAGAAYYNYQLSNPDRSKAQKKRDRDQPVFGLRPSPAVKASRKRSNRRKIPTPAPAPKKF